MRFPCQLVSLILLLFFLVIYIWFLGLFDALLRQVPSVHFAGLFPLRRVLWRSLCPHCRQCHRYWFAFLDFVIYCILLSLITVKFDVEMKKNPKFPIKLKGAAIGNGIVDPLNQANSQGNFAYVLWRRKRKRKRKGKGNGNGERVREEKDKEEWSRKSVSGLLFICSTQFSPLTGWRTISSMHQCMRKQWRMQSNAWR